MTEKAVAKIATAFGIYLTQIIFRLIFLVFLSTRLWPTFPWCSRTSFRFLDLQIHVGIVLNAYDPQKQAKRLRGHAFATDHLAHIKLIYVKREQNSPLIDFPFDFYVIRMVDKRFHDIFKKFLFGRGRCICHRFTGFLSFCSTMRRGHTTTGQHN